MRGALMVCGTASDSGKSVVVAGLCRLLARDNVRVAPFKGQNMSLNSFVTESGHEIGRAQAAQAMAAGVTPEVAMNPVLLKPTDDRRSQVMVLGQPWATVDAREYHDRKPQLLPVVLDALADLRRRFDVVVVEGAGSPAEINLLDHDIVNLRVAVDAGVPAILVGDIDRGGVFASLYGTVELLPDELRRQVRGFVINKFRGDPALLDAGVAELERRTGIPTLGVLAWSAGLSVDAEDSLALERPFVSAGPPIADPLDIAVIRFPRISNVTDVDPLTQEPGVTVRLVDSPQTLGDPDLVILPGTKATVADSGWLRSTGLASAIERAAGLVLGVCGGQQMMGTTIDDAVESGAGRVDGLGWLDVTTTFRPDKILRQRRGTAMGHDVAGYCIHHGVVQRGPGTAGWVHLDDAHGVEDDGAVEPAAARFLATSLHGLLEADGFRATFLSEVGRRAGKTFVPAGVSFAAARDQQFETAADLLAAHLDCDAIAALVKEGAP